MGTNYNPKAVSDSVLCSLDFKNVKNYNSDNLTGRCSITGLPFTTNNSSYVTVTDGYATFDRAASAPTLAEKSVAGGVFKTNNLFNSSYSSIKYNSFYYNDHTVEILFRINDASPSNYDATETSSSLLSHRGYNNGLNYNTTNIQYSIWNGGAGGITIFSWSIANESPVGKWNHIGVTRSGDNWTKYTKGLAISTTTQSLSTNPNMNSNNGLGDIGLGGTLVNNANFQYYAKCSIALFRMYSRALTADEMLQNFRATQGRFNL